MTSDELIALEHENWIAYLTGVVSCSSRTSVTRAGDDPVVSGLGWRTARTARVYSITTIPSARQRGYGAATDSTAARSIPRMLEASHPGNRAQPGSG